MRHRRFSESFILAYSAILAVWSNVGSKEFAIAEFSPNHGVFTEKSVFRKCKMTGGSNADESHRDWRKYSVRNKIGLRKARVKHGKADNQEFIHILNKIDAETPPNLDLHLVVDNYATHKHPRAKSWLQRHPRFHIHFTPTSSSWLSLVQRWFREIIDKRIRRGSFHSVPELIAAFQDYLECTTNKPLAF